MQTQTLGQLAQYVGGKVCGDPNVVIKSASTLESGGEGDISFLANRKYTSLLSTTKASAVVVAKEIESPASLLVTDDPYYAFTQIVILLYGHRNHNKSGISGKASIAKSAKIGKDSHIHDFAVVSDNVSIGDNSVLYPGVFIGPDTKIGSDCILYPNVVVYDNCVVGNRVIIQANATVGEDGFGYATHKGVHHKIPHIGRTVIEDDVELGAGCAIERGTLDDTVIGKGSKIGDSVVIGHGTKVGPHCLFVAQVGIAGSTTMGHHCVAGGQAGIVGHIDIGNMVQIGAQAGVINDIPDGKMIVGTPAIDAIKAKRAYGLIEFLPQMRKSIQEITKRLDAMEK